MRGEILRDRGRAAPGEISRRGAEQAADVGDLAQGEARILHAGDPDRDIDALLDEIEQMVGQAQAHFGLRLQVAVARQHRRDDAPPEAERRRHMKIAARRGAALRATLASARSTASTTSTQRSKKTRPASVRLMLRVVRVSRRLLR